MANSKFELTSEQTFWRGITLYRIRALQDLPYFNVKTGDLGGFVQAEANLSTNDNSWVGGNAKVYGNASLKVSQNSLITDLSELGDTASVSVSSIIKGKSLITNTCAISSSSVVDNCFISGDCTVQSSYLVDASMFGKVAILRVIAAKGAIFDGTFAMNDTNKKFIIRPNAVITNSNYNFY